MLNIIAGVFVERALTKSQYDRDLLVEKEIQAKQAYVQNLKIMFEEGDRDRSGTISFQEFEAHLKDERVAAYLSHLAVDINNINELFEQLDRDRSGSISVQEFVDNLLHLARGQTVEQLAHRIMSGNQELKHLIYQFKELVEVEFAKIKFWIEQPSDSPAAANHVEVATIIERDSPRSNGPDAEIRGPILIF